MYARYGLPCAMRRNCKNRTDRLKYLLPPPRGVALSGNAARQGRGPDPIGGDNHELNNRRLIR